MMKKILSLLAFGGFAASCNNNPNPTLNKTPVKERELITEEKSGSACFAYLNQKDSITLHINIKATAVTGELTYNLFEKDKNTGTIKGEMKGDTLFADYSFNAEGMNSVREVAFLKKGNDLVEGFGEVTEKNGKVAFKNKATLNFDNKIALAPIECNTK